MNLKTSKKGKGIILVMTASTTESMIVYCILCLCWLAVAVSSSSIPQESNPIVVQVKNRFSSKDLSSLPHSAATSSETEEFDEMKRQRRKIAVGNMDWDINYVIGTTELTFNTDGSDHTARMTWTKTIGRDHRVELYEKGCVEKITLDPVNGPFISIISTNLENVYNPSDTDTQYFSVEVAMKSDIQSSPYFDVVADDTALIEFCVHVDLAMTFEESDNIFTTTSINFSEIEMLLQLDLQTVAGFSIADVKLEKNKNKNCLPFTLKHRNEYTWDDFQDYSQCGGYSCLKQDFSGENRNKPITSIHFPIFMESELDDPKKEDFIVEFYRPGCHVAVPNNVMSTDIIFPEVQDGFSEANTPDIVVVGTWENAKIKLNDKLFTKKNGKDGRLAFCIIVKRACLGYAPSTTRKLLIDGDGGGDHEESPFTSRETVLLQEEYELDTTNFEREADDNRQLGQVDSDYNQLIIETSLAVNMNDEGNIIGYDPSNDNTTYEYTGGGDSTGVVVTTRVDYDFQACQCNSDTMQCESSALSNGGILHLCFLFANQTSPASGVVWAGVDYLFLTRSDNSEVERIPINDRIPDDLTAIFNTGTQSMRVSTMLTSAFFNPATGLQASGTVLIGFGSSARRLDFTVDLFDQPNEKGDAISAPALNDFFDWTRTLEADHRRRQLLEKSSGTKFDIQVELKDEPAAGGNDGATVVPDIRRRSPASKWCAGSAIVGFSFLVTCFVLVIVKRRTDQKEEAEMLHLAQKGEVTLPIGLKTSMECRNSGIMHCHTPSQNGTDYTSECTRTTVASYTKEKTKKNNVETIQIN
mmetsp:Transcript_2928/g.4551  ORF Transcript_2928/g.4551 Transcript_2928/m.4551 type:complete len:811 (+) Transcript_2928:151-2583(+)|eukprot:CAMPEP_0195308278 /NCGR_PEP_ID=MMETSP0707-20130614/38142_1 /TAXON_ID=33640 /ORGANISM="Asterionellopsis glacialis, Strain CCMP134" /LENGTH=810 /DNA_ID=CAMNT_0040372543 /DNA_START=131 /DNA_END=2563 /DNA_ORIENTATION=-